MTKLKPCPFCGSKEITLYETTRFDFSRVGYCVTCEMCYAEGGKAKSRAGARQLWNKRERVDND